MKELLRSSAIEIVVDIEEEGGLSVVNMRKTIEGKKYLNKSHKWGAKGRGQGGGGNWRGCNHREGKKNPDGKSNRINSSMPC